MSFSSPNVFYLTKEKKLKQNNPTKQIMDWTQVLKDNDALIGPGEGVFWVKYLPCKCEDLNLDSPNSCKAGCGNACLQPQGSSPGGGKTQASLEAYRLASLCSQWKQETLSQTRCK